MDPESSSPFTQQPATFHYYQPN